MINQSDELDCASEDVVYAYVESVFRSSNQGLTRLDVKLGTVALFDGLFICLSSDTAILAIPKGVVYLFLVVSTLVCVLGLMPKPVGRLAEPKELLQSFYCDTPTRTKIYIVKGWDQTIDDLRQAAQTKAARFKAAITLSAIAVSLYATFSLIDF